MTQEQEVDISYWERTEIDKIAGALSRKVSDKQAGWVWQVEFYEGDEESGIGANWTLAGESEKHKLTIMIYLGEVPWFTRWRLYFTMDGKEYRCLEEMFRELPSLKRLETKLNRIAVTFEKKENTGKTVEYEQGERRKAR